MITKEEAVTAQEFHHVTESQGGGKECYRVRRNGQTQVWARTPDRFRIPVKHGLRDYGQIYDHNAAEWNAANGKYGTCARCSNPGSLPA